MLEAQNKNIIQQLFKQFIKTKPDLFPVLKPGDLIEGKILEKGTNRITVDLGRHGMAAVYREEIQNAREIVRGLKPGDPVHGKVMIVDNEDGVVELSLTEAGKQKAWLEVQELQGAEEILKVTVKGSNKGGLIADLRGLSAFLPTSQLAGQHLPRPTAEERVEIGALLQKLIGTEISVKIIDVNPRLNKLIISERAANEVSTKELIKNYEVGETIEGIISGVADFGAFVKFTDNPAVEGLIHVSELSHRVIENPKEVVKVDDGVKVKIIEIKDGKIYLSLKTLLVDPWLKVLEKYRAGEVVQGKIYAFHPYGAIVNLDNDLQGQIHISEFGGVAEMKEKLALGEKYSFTIESIKPEEKRIALKFSS